MNEVEAAGWKGRRSGRVMTQWRGAAGPGRMVSRRDWIVRRRRGVKRSQWRGLSQAVLEPVLSRASL